MNRLLDWWWGVTGGNFVLWHVGFIVAVIFPVTLIGGWLLHPVLWVSIPTGYIGGVLGAELAQRFFR